MVTAPSLFESEIGHEAPGNSEVVFLLRGLVYLSILTLGSGCSGLT